MAVRTLYFATASLPRGEQEKCEICNNPFNDSTQEVVEHELATVGSVEAVFHTFHKGCLQERFEQKETCPTCDGKARFLPTLIEMQEEIEKLGDPHEEEKVLDLLRVFVIGAVAILPIVASVYYIHRYAYLALGIRDIAELSWSGKYFSEFRLARLGFKYVSCIALGGALLMNVCITRFSTNLLRRELEASNPWFFHQSVVAMVFAIYCQRTWRGEEILSLLEKGQFTAFVITPLLSGISAATIHLFRKNFLGTPLPR